MTNRRPARAASAAGARTRVAQSLAPTHLGEATAAATVAVIVGGIALVITGIGIVVMALTLGTRWSESAPPNAGSLAILPALLGTLLLLLGGGLTAGGVAVLGAAPRARLGTGILSGVAALLSAAGVVTATVVPPPDPVLGVALTVAAAVFGVSALLLLRPRR